jgi:hypothetical protein
MENISGEDMKKREEHRRQAEKKKRRDERKRQCLQFLSKLGWDTSVSARARGGYVVLNASLDMACPFGHITGGCKT